MRKIVSRDFIEDTKALHLSNKQLNRIREATTKILSTLTPREERVLRMRFERNEYRSYFRGSWFTIFSNKRKNKTN